MSGGIGVEGRKASSTDTQSKSEPSGGKPSPSNDKQTNVPSFFSPLAKTIDLPLIGPTPRYYFLLVFLFIIYMLSKSILIGLLAGALMVAIVLFEFYMGAKEGGVVNELKHTAIAIGLVVVIWFAAGFALQTANPINAIVSCSMLPAYERGDFVILGGGQINTADYTFAGSANAINSSALIIWKNETFGVQGSLLVYCANDNRNEERCAAFIRSPADFVERHGPLELRYGACRREKADGTTLAYSTICVRETRLMGQLVSFNSSNDLIVYSPKQTDLYARVGDIVHRARLRINTADGPVLLTKGDNNPIYDLQAYDYATNTGNSPVAANQLKGHVLLRIPYLGNLKLFISPQILADPSALSGCDSHFENGAR